MADYLVLTLDVNDLDRQATFWAAALGYEVSGGVGQYRALSDPAGRSPKLLLQTVAEPKAAKNRLHLDLHVPDVEAEAARLEGLPDRVAEADALVMNWFGLDVELLGRLTPEEVLSLKAEGLTQQYLGVLRECIAECQRRFDAHADPRAAAAEGADVLATLQAHIASRCEAERKWRFAQAGATTH